MKIRTVEKFIKKIEQASVNGMFLYANCTPEVQNNDLAIMALLKHSPRSIAMLDIEKAVNPKFVAIALENGTDVSNVIDKSFKTNETKIIEMLKFFDGWSGSALNVIDSSLQANDKFMQKVLSVRPKIYSHLTSQQQKVFSFAGATVKADNEMIKHIDQGVKENPEFVLEYCLDNHTLFKGVYKYHNKNHKTMVAAINHNSEFVIYADESLRNTKNFMFEIAEKNEELLRNSGPKLLNDLKFVGEVYNKYPKVELAKTALVANKQSVKELKK